MILKKCDDNEARNLQADFTQMFCRLDKLLVKQQTLIDYIVEDLAVKKPRILFSMDANNSLFVNSSEDDSNDEDDGDDLVT